MADLTGTRVVVIGGASGIGFAIAQLAHAAGAAIIIGSSSEANVAAATAKLAGSTGHRIDLRDEASVEAFFHAVGRFDHLAITAGDWSIPMRGSVRDIDLAAARDALTVRFWGSVMATKHAARTLSPSGSITLTSGMIAHRPPPGMPLAAAIGGAMEHLARGLATDLAPIRVNAVCPGLVLTDAVQSMYPPALVTGMTANQPVPRPATPAEAASAYLYAMQGSYVTGQVLPVDGGGLLV